MQKRLFELPRELRSAATSPGQCARERENYCPVGVPEIPTSADCGGCAARRFQPVTPSDDAVLGLPSFRAPTPVHNSVRQRPIQRSSIRPGLPTRDDSDAAPGHARLTFVCDSERGSRPERQAHGTEFWRTIIHSGQANNFVQTIGRLGTCVNKCCCEFGVIRPLDNSTKHVGKLQSSPRPVEPLSGCRCHADLRLAPARLREYQLQSESQN